MPFGHAGHTCLRPREPWGGRGRRGRFRVGRRYGPRQASPRFRSPAGTATESVLPGGGKGQMK